MIHRTSREKVRQTGRNAIRRSRRPAPTNSEVMPRPGRLLPGTQPGKVAAGTEKLCEVRATQHPVRMNEA